tara:strand:+ start:924 stop:3038 length:2115 start_codon:yes stop_codon:yes gene_type:complete
MNKKLKIYFGDVIHNQGMRTRVVPMGIATLATALKDTFKDNVSTKLFVYPNKIFDYVEKFPPDIIALSNYIWNSKLSLKILREVKKNFPNTLTVMGGPHCRTDQEGLKNFTKKNPFVDVYIPFEAENPFINLVGAYLKNNDPTLKTLPNIEGVYLNKENYEFKKIIPKKNDKKSKYNSDYYTINQFSSPYLSGMLDEFLEDPQLSPLLESNRGCPYSCTFCAWGVGSGNKLIKKDYHKFLSEIWYVAERSKNDVWFLADGNFGILKEDVEIAKNFKELREKFGYPNAIIYNTAKNNPDRVFEVSDILGELAPVNIAVQAFDNEVLKNIKRKNLTEEEIREYVLKHQKKKRTVSTDIIVPNTGETLKSHLDSLRKFFDLNFDIGNLNIMRMLPGTEMEGDKERDHYGIKTKWRPMDAGWGEYKDEFIFETDENTIATKHISEEEMYGLKKIHFLTNLFWSSGVGRNLLKIGQIFQVNPLDVIISVANDKTSDIYKNVLEPLEKEFKNEWFNTEEDLLRHYSRIENHKKLLSNEEGLTKLNLKYLANLILEKETVHNSIYLLKKYIKKICGKNINDELLDLATTLSIHKLRIDLLKSPLKKKIEYNCSSENFKILIDKKIIPDYTEFRNQKFTLNYNFPEIRFIRMKKRLQSLNFNDKPKQSLYGALTVGSAKFLYNFENPNSKVNLALKDKKDNALSKADNLRAT